MQVSNIVMSASGEAENVCRGEKGGIQRIEKEEPSPPQAVMRGAFPRELKQDIKVRIRWDGSHREKEKK